MIPIQSTYDHNQLIPGAHQELIQEALNALKDTIGAIEPSIKKIQSEIQEAMNQYNYWQSRLMNEFNLFPQYYEQYRKLLTLSQAEQNTTLSQADKHKEILEILSKTPAIDIMTHIKNYEKALWILYGHYLEIICQYIILCQSFIEQFSNELQSKNDSIHALSAKILDGVLLIKALKSKTEDR